MCGAAPIDEGPFVRRELAREDLKKRLPKLAAMTRPSGPSLPGVFGDRAHQMVAGGLVAEAVMDLFDIDALEICPWALREGVILEKLDLL